MISGAIEIVDVLLYAQKKCKTYTPSRSYCALSYRIDSDSCFEYKKVKIPAKTNSLAFVPSNLQYARTTEGERAIVVHFNVFGMAPKEIMVANPCNFLEYKSIFKQILALWQEKQIGYTEKCTALLYEALYMIKKDNLFAVEAQDLASKTAQYIDCGFTDKNLSVAFLAEKEFVSTAYLRKVFTTRFGISPKKYLLQKRMEHAKELLSLGYFSQTEISDRCGYEDVKYFRTAFKKSEGITITQFISGKFKREFD